MKASRGLREDRLFESSTQIENREFLPNRNFNDSLLFFSSNIINSFYYHCHKALFLKILFFFRCWGGQRERDVRRFWLFFFLCWGFFFVLKKSEKVPKLILKEFKKRTKTKSDILALSAHSLTHTHTLFIYFKLNSSTSTLNSFFVRTNSTIFWTSSTQFVDVYEFRNNQLIH